MDKLTDQVAESVGAGKAVPGGHHGASSWNEAIISPSTADIKGRLGDADDAGFAGQQMPERPAFFPSRGELRPAGVEGY